MAFVCLLLYVRLDVVSSQQKWELEICVVGQSRGLREKARDVSKTTSRTSESLLALV